MLLISGSTHMFAFLTSVLSVSSVFKTSQQVIQEKGIPLEIAGGEAAGFGGEAVGPCEACALHPGWGIGFGAGIDIEGEAHCEKDAAGEEGFEAL